MCGPDIPHIALECQSENYFKYSRTLPYEHSGPVLFIDGKLGEVTQF